MRKVFILWAFGLLVCSSAAIADLGAEIVDPVPLNNNAATDSGPDRWPQIVTDGAGNWVAVWYSLDSLGGTIGADEDILVARSANNGVTWTDPEPLNNNAATDSGPDFNPQLATDGAGIWIAVWYSQEDLGGTIGVDRDILVARSTDDGATWTDPEPLNNNAATDIQSDRHVQIVTDADGSWVAVWQSRQNLGGTIGEDDDIFVARSTDNGVTWTDPQTLNNNADTDTGDDRFVEIATDTSGNWVAAWYSQDDLGGTIGTDLDILVAQSTDNGVTWTVPQALHTNADSDSLEDRLPVVTTDTAGNWVAAWYSQNDLGGTIGTDYDIHVARSVDNGATWTDPEALNTNADTDSGGDFNPQLVTDATGNWIAVWFSQDDLGGTIGTDNDVLASRSTDNGVTWSDPEPLNTTAASTTGSGADWYPQVTVNTTGTWVFVWRSDDSLDGTIGTDSDILVARFFFGCGEYEADHRYGRPLFAFSCTRDAVELPASPSTYDSLLLSYNRQADVNVYLTSQSTGFSSIDVVAADELYIDGSNVGLGIYTDQPGIPPYMMYAPIEQNLVPKASHPLMDDIPVGLNDLLFELIHTGAEIYGNTSLYLVRDCGIWVDENESGQTRIHWVSHDVDVNGIQSDLDLVSGLVSDLRVDQDFTSSCFLGAFLDATQVLDTRVDPPTGDGYYYLVDGTCGTPAAYGSSSLDPDPRDALPPGSACP